MNSASRVSSESLPTRNPWRLLVILAAAALLLIPIWTNAFPPLLDYPNHLARSFILVHLHDPAFHFSQFYSADWGLYPYLGMDTALAVLDRVFAIETAGRVFLSLCVLAIPGAAWFFLEQVNPGDEAGLAWALLLSYNVFFLEGFLDFDFSLAVGFMAVGLWLRWLAKPRLGSWMATLVAFTALYLAHLLGFTIAGLVLVAYLAFARRPLRDWLWSVALAVPGVALYFHSSRVGIGATKIVFHGFAVKLSSLRMILHGYWHWLDWLSVALLGLCLLLARFLPGGRWNKRWLGIAAFMFALYWVIPWMWGEGSDLDVRVLPVFFVLILATVRPGPHARCLLPIPICLFALQSASVITHFRAVQPELAGLAGSFDVVPRNALVFPIVEGEEDAIERPFTHFWAYGVIRRGWFSPYMADLPGQTPMRITYDSYTANGFWDLVYDEPPDWERVRSDYEYAWAYDVPRFAPALARIGDKIYSYGGLEVYRLHKLPSDNSVQNVSAKAAGSEER